MPYGCLDFLSVCWCLMQSKGFFKTGFVKMNWLRLIAIFTQNGSDPSLLFSGEELLNINKRQFIAYTYTFYVQGYHNGVRSYSTVNSSKTANAIV